MPIIDPINGIAAVSLPKPVLNNINDGEIVGETVANRPHNELLSNDIFLASTLEDLEENLHNNHYTKATLQSGVPGNRVNWNSVFNTNHNTLGNLQGGVSGEYYHLTSDLNTFVADLYTEADGDPANLKSGGDLSPYSGQTLVFNVNIDYANSAPSVFPTVPERTFYFDTGVSASATPYKNISGEFSGRYYTKHYSYNGSWYFREEVGATNFTFTTYLNTLYKNPSGTTGWTIGLDVSTGFLVLYITGHYVGGSQATSNLFVEGVLKVYVP